MNKFFYIKRKKYTASGSAGWTNDFPA